jgi:hypothetical protein
MLRIVSPQTHEGNMSSKDMKPEPIKVHKHVVILNEDSVVAVRSIVSAKLTPAKREFVTYNGILGMLISILVGVGQESSIHFIVAAACFVAFMYGWRTRRYILTIQTSDRNTWTADFPLKEAGHDAAKKALKRITMALSLVDTPRKPAASAAKKTATHKTKAAIN